MFQTLALSVLSHFVQALIGSGVFGEITNLVVIAAASDKTGAEKSAMVKDGLKNLKGDVGVSVGNTAAWALNFGVEAAVAQINIKAGVSPTVSK